MDDYQKRCQAKFVIGWLTMQLIGMGVSRDEVEAQIAKAEAEWVRIFVKEFTVTQLPNRDLQIK